MLSDPRVFSGVYADHMKKVREGGYAFINDRTSLLMERFTDCGLALVLVEELLTPYAIGMQLNSPYERLIKEV